MSKSDSGWFDGTSSQGQALIQEVIDNGYKITPENVMGIVKNANDDIIWLETGNSSSGFQHILEHSEQFNDVGIPDSSLSNFILNAVAKNNIVGYQGKNTDRPIYQIDYNGKSYYVAVTISENGYIVGANPKTKLKDKEKI